MDHVLTSLDMFDAISENLIDYTFNVSCLISDGWEDSDEHFKDGFKRYERGYVSWLILLAIDIQ